MSRCFVFGLAWMLLAGSARGGLSTSELVLEEGTSFAVAVSPDGSRLVFDLQGTLWSLPVEGGDAEALTDGLGDDRLPDWSPDGSRLVFQSFRKGTWDIWSIGSDGSGLEPLTESTFDDREPDWSPDGSQVAFASDRSGNYDIWVLDVSSNELTRLSQGESEDYMPAWSPDGSSIAFLSERGEDGAAELWKIDVGAGQEERMASFDGKAAAPAWSSDGKRIALRVLEFQSLTMMDSRFDEGISSQLVTLPSDGGELTQLYAGEDVDVFPFRPAWTNAGDIFFTAEGKIRHLAAGTGDVETVPFRARVTLDRPAYRRREARIREPGERFPVRGIVRPSVSPDGSRIAFTALGDLWMVPVEGGAPAPLTRDEYLDSDPSWSPDGQRLVFASDRMDTMDLWIKDVESSPRSGERQLTALPGAEIGPSWSPDGKWIAFLDERSNVYAVEVEGGSEPRLIHQTLRWAGLPSWSSDSRHLAVAVHEPFSTRFREGLNRIKVLSVDSEDERILDVPSKSFGSRDGDGPVWSPDGRNLAFAMDGGIWILPVTAAGEPDGPLRKVVDEAADFIGWFPDSESLVYMASEELKRVDVDSGRSRVVPLTFEYEVLPAGGKMLIRAGRLIDGTGRPPRDDVEILINGNRIESIEPEGTTSTEGLRVIDASTKTVVPGLIESHTHLGLPAWGAQHGRVWLAYGVTSMRTVVDATYRVLEERESIASGRRIGPRVFLTGFSFDGDFVTSHEIYPAVAYGVDGIEHLRGTSRRGFSPKVTDLRRSYRDVVDLVSQSGVYFTPTLLIQGGFRLARAREPELLKEKRFAKLYPAWAASGFQTNTDDQVGERQAVVAPLLQTVDAVARANGKVLAGTDSPIVPYGLSLILEIELLSEAGLGPLQAIRSATQLAAEALGADKELGTVEPGKQADMVILGGDPSQDIRNLRLTEQVILGGRIVTVDQLLR